MRPKILLLVRRLHLYLSVFFAPLLALFVFTGLAQTMDFDHAAPVLRNLSSLHTRQVYPAVDKTTPGNWRGAAVPMKWLIAAMSVALLISILLGLVLAFTTARNRSPALIALLLGVIVPIVLVLLAHWQVARQLSR